MGKFDGVLIASDYDNTITYTEGALLRGEELPPVPPENRQAIEYFMAQGGTFSVATGRALPAFVPIAPTIPMNGPTVLFNGAAIYDFSAGRYLHTAFLPETVRDHVRQILAALPRTAMEIYHDDNSIHALNPNEITHHHLHLTHMPTVVLDSVDQVPFPVSKILFEENPPRMGQLTAYIAAQPWAADYEVVLSAANLLELTAHGANKGGMVQKLVELLGADRRHVYCIGDHANDIPMLRLSRIPFAPANAIESVRQVPGVHVLPHCQEGAIAAMIEELDKLY
ncbi:MAG: HAD-IIB family hydrolase [Oscillospiraceae bacterium]|nr:HAD-IIB family hydrolase [Oscillospiraceae bacterium]